MILSSRLPLGADLFIHPQRRQLVDGNDHRLALIAAIQETAPICSISSIYCEAMSARLGTLRPNSVSFR